MKKKMKSTTVRQTVYLVECIRYGAEYLEVCSSRKSADRLIQKLCSSGQHSSYLYPYHFSIRCKRVK